MREYKFINQSDSLCVPVHIESLLDRKGITIDQREIADNLGFPNGNVVIKKDLEPLKSFFRKYDLGISFFRPTMEFIEPDLYLRDLVDSQDVIVGFSYHELYSGRSVERNDGHFSLLSEFRRGDIREILLHDNMRGRIEAVKLDDLVSSMLPNPVYGFYLVDNL